LKRFFLILLFVLLLLLIVFAINTLRFNSKQVGPIGVRKQFPVSESAVSHLSAAITFRTISYDQDSLIDHTSFDSLISFLCVTYPLTFEKLQVDQINKHSLLLSWRNFSSKKKPAILYAHLDVVPADERGISQWQHFPFTGMVDEKFIYGRGSIDDKGSVIAIMESVEKLLANNFQPSRDIYIAFGHDEEIGGMNGAYFIAKHLEEKKVKAEFLLDEGGLIATEMVPFVKDPVALIATSEKGYMTVKLEVKGSGGHSSFPPKEPPAEILSKAIQSVHYNPFESRMSESVNDFMNYIGPHMSTLFKAVFANRWLTRPIIFREYEKIPSANAMIHTTSVTTMISGGIKENVVPHEVTALVNFRLLPGDKSKEVLDKVKKKINDERVIVTVHGKVTEASEVSGVDDEGFKILQHTIKDVYPDVIVAPYLLIGATDSRHFSNVTENTYRFLPVRMTQKILDTMHGTDEKIGIQDFMESIGFYEGLMRKL
jgi:carboxypeptidase PM20D1